MYNYTPKYSSLLDDYIYLSRKLWSKIEDVQWWWWNTSVKLSEDLMLIKASWTLLKDIKKDSLWVGVKFDEVVWWFAKLVHSKTNENELLLEELIVANTQKTDKKASIETSMHSIIPFKYVLHNHNVYTNIFNCMYDGHKLLKELLDIDFWWVEYESPWLGLSTNIYKKYNDNIPEVLFLENHWIIVSWDTIWDIEEKYKYVINKLCEYLTMHDIQLFQNDIISHVDSGFDCKMLPQNMLSDFVDKSQLKEFIFPDLVVFGNDLVFDNKSISITDTSVYLKWIWEKKATSILENLVAMNYILFVHNRLKFDTKKLLWWEVSYIVNMWQEKYRQSLHK